MRKSGSSDGDDWWLLVEMKPSRLRRKPATAGSAIWQPPGKTPNLQWSLQKNAHDVARSMDCRINQPVRWLREEEEMRTGG
ncbi:hypothetical protein Q1695_015366 [Nippostrongylus brasiliensis]|nr:hypothetical protein Q1695_015366 [Nippostrongylus brasiliensis]